MQPQNHFPIPLCKLVLTLGLSTAAHAIAADFTWAQVPMNSASPSPTAELREDDMPSALPPSPFPVSDDGTSWTRRSPAPTDLEVTDLEIADQVSPAPAAHSDHLTPHLTPSAELPSPSSPDNSVSRISTDDGLQSSPSGTGVVEEFSTQAYDLQPRAQDFVPINIDYENFSFDDDISFIGQLRLSQESGTDEAITQAPEEGIEEAGEVPEVTTEEDEFNVPITGEEKDFSIGIGSVIQEPTALEGATRDLPVAAQFTVFPSISLTGHIRQRLADNQFVLLELIAGPDIAAADLSYTIDPEFVPGAFSANFFSTRSLSPSFEEGDTEVDLSNGEDPRVHRIGGGFEYAQSVTPSFDIATGINYQLISVRDAVFADGLETEDELGNALTVSDDGQDSLLTISFNGLFDKVSGQDFALQGTRIRFGVDQSIPVGDANIFFNRIVANATQFIPLRIFTGEPGTFVLNLQGGVTFGDVPPYESLNLGGDNTVRGFEEGDLGSGSSFIQATAEYRFPLFSFTAFDVPLGIGGVVFVDYASDFSTADLVIGDPAEVRDKSGDGLGYGLGLHSTTPFGLLRLEFGFNDQGGNEFHFEIGDRF